jgi:indolepyruvate ferredoxin oxidoreductase
MSPPAAGPVALDDRYLREKGLVYLTGVQALVRLLLEQNRRDRRAGLRIGTFVSGYPGSPLGGYDAALARIARIAEQHDIVHVPGANEELAATALMGTQMLDRHPHGRWDGVTGVWYGKGPGVDRSGDALKHGNFAGTSRHGAVILLAAEDHEGKSSTMPFQDDYAFAASGIPVLYPSSVGEFLTLGLHAIALSRFSGCWVALKCVGALCDGGEIIEVAPEAPSIATPELSIAGRPFEKRTDFTFFPGTNAEFERHLYQERHLAVVAYARANGLDRVEARTPRDRIGIVTAGKSHADTRQALADLGVGHEDLRRAGIRLLRVGCIYPVDQRLIREFADGLAEIVVVEEKRGFLEAQVKEALCGLGQPLRVVGKLDEEDRPLFPLHGGMDSDVVAERLGPRLLPHLDEDGRARARRRLAEIGAVRGRSYAAHPGRTPNYCSGCPHNTSTVLLPGQVAWGSPGCHSFATVIEQPERHIEAMTQYGGEGLPWVGLSRFTDRAHMVQNVGDGSLFHSSYLNIRFCVAAGADITFRILYNGAIANTGAQAPVGARSVPALTRLLTDEGVTRIALVTKRPRAYRRRELGAATRVYPASEHDRAMRDLRAERGVTVLIYDEACANERRRRQKRGTEAAPTRFVVINEDVCEACGHCGQVTNCMSLQRVETEFGEKTQVHPSTCNQDYSCLKGDCPSFLTVETREGTGYARPRPAPLAADAVPEPARRAGLDRPCHIYIPGVGGTGVITVNALLGWAALLDGRRVLSYDQTGAAQKWGPVLSSLVVMPDPDLAAANKVGLGRADVYLALDPLAASTPVNLDRCAPDRTSLVCVTPVMPTGEMVRTGGYGVPIGAIRESIGRHCRPDRTVFADARWVAEGLFRDHMMVNMLAVGVAYQAGFLPLTAESIEAAVRLNGVAVDDNLQAFRYGRLYFHDPLRVESLVRGGEARPDEVLAAAVAALTPRERRDWERLRAACGDLDEESRRLVALRAAELIGYQDAAYAGAYVAFVRDVAARERALGGDRREITRAVARFLYKLMAYKDEYEVARLHLAPAMAARIADLFSAPRRVSYHFHPPLLRALGLRRKLELGPWFSGVLGLLRRLRRLRGTRWDPFGRAAVRREERALPGWYRDLVTRALARLEAETYDAVVELARVPDQIRGYEDIKLRNAAAARERAAALGGRLEARARSSAAPTRP